MEIRLTSTGKRDLDKLQEDIKKQVIEGIKKINLPVADIKKIKGKAGFKRLRAGDYRVLFKKDGKKTYIINVKHRREVYRNI